MLAYSRIHRAPRSGPRRRDAAVSLGTSRFTANLFHGVNHATLIFTQLCSPAQGAAAVSTSAPTCPRSRPEATTLPVLSQIPPLARTSNFHGYFRSFCGRTRLLAAKYKDFRKFRQLAIARPVSFSFYLRSWRFCHLTIFLALYFPGAVIHA